MGETALRLDLSFIDAIEGALSDFDRFVTKTWLDYGVRESLLAEEMETWYHYAEWRGKKLVEEIRWRNLGTTLQRTLYKRRESIRLANDIPSLSKALEKGRQTAHLVACYLWAREKVPGPSSSLSLMKKAQKAESLARYLDKKGLDHNAEKQRARAKIMRRIAAGEDLELPTRAGGSIAKLREIYAKLDSDGKPHERDEYLNLGAEAGIHPGTCKVQYARWKREHQ